MALVKVACATAFVLISNSLHGCGGGGGGDGSDGSPPWVDYRTHGFRGFSWGPMWLLDESCIEAFSPICQGPFKSSDISADWGSTIWSAKDDGRGDLDNIKAIGANTVRLYGNDQRMNKKQFLDYARSLQLQVVEGLTGFVYTEGGGPMCASVKRSESCYDAVLDTFSKNLENGFLEGPYYHNAISVINLANEPDFFGIPNPGSGKGPNYLWAMITAFDAILSAEGRKGVKPWTNSKLPYITATWSFSDGKSLGVDVCTPEFGINDRATECGPGFAFMVQFARAVQDPETYVGYTPINNLQEAFKDRWLNTVQLFVDADQVKQLFLDRYMAIDVLKDTPVVATEWHGQGASPTTGDKLMQDLQKFESWRPTSQWLGISFFQYQVAYQKGPEERIYGLFGLGKTEITQTKEWYTENDDGSHDYGAPQAINCLEIQNPHAVQQIAQAWGGASPTHGLCTSSRAAVSSDIALV